MRIGIIDDHAMVRDLLATVCHREFKCHVVVTSETGEGAVDTIIDKKPDLLILDLMLPDIDGFGVADRVRYAGLAPKILSMSSRCDPYTTYRVEKARFHGFLDKKCALVKEIQHALTALTSGKPFFSESFLRIQEDRRNNPQAFDKVLTQRQHRVLCLIGALFSDTRIAKELRVTPSAIEKARFRIMKRLGIRSKEALFAYTRANGFLPLTGEFANDFPKWVPGGSITL